MKQRPVASSAKLPAAWRSILLQYAGLLLALLALLVAFSLKTNHFLSLTTLRTISNQIPDAVLLAVGMTLVMIVGGIDLSVGSVLALSGAILGVCLVQWHWPLLPALVLCLVTGLSCGVVNGLITTQWKLPASLKRGENYSWAVGAVVNGEEITAPSVTESEVRFRVLGDTEWRALQQLQQTTDSHLALGVFYAHNGLLDEAQREFQQLVNFNPDSPQARKLLRLIQSWR